MIDFHCHLDLYPEPESVADSLQARGIGALSVTNTPSAWRGTARLASGRAAIRTGLGLHPQLAFQRKHEMDLFHRFLPETAFVGEVGLDGSPAFRGFWDEQVSIFDEVLHACADHGGRVLSIHSRRAASAVLGALDRRPGYGAAILHWFSGSTSELESAISANCWFSVGPAMLAGAKGRALVQRIPSSRILLETDGPFATSGGTRLKPWDVSLATNALAELWQVQSDSAREQIERNERNLIASARRQGI